VRVESDFATFGFSVFRGNVIQSAPIGRWMIGKPGRDMVNYWRARGATVTWKPEAME